MMARQSRLNGNPLAEMRGPGPVGLLYLDTSGECVSANTQWRDLVRSSSEGPQGRGWLEGFPPEEQERMRQCWVAASLEEFSRDAYVLSPRHSVKKVRLDGLPVCKGDHVPVGFILAVREISVRDPDLDAQEETAWPLTHRVRALQFLLEIPKIVERTGGMSIRDIVEGIADLLPSALQYPEIAFSQIILDGEHFGVSPETASPAWLERVDILVHGKIAGALELGYHELPPSGGESLLLAEERNLLNSVAQRLGRMVERIRDAERLQEKEEQLRVTVTHMNRVAVAGEMAANIAHELNQPLAAITSFAEGSRRSLNGENTDFGRLSQALTWIAEEALRAGEIIQRMTSLVKKRETCYEVLDLNEVIRSVNHLGSVYARINRVQLALELDPDLPPVRGDKVQIQQVLLNLIRNGVQAAMGGNSGNGRVVVGTGTLSPSEVEVSVEDNGWGLPTDQEEEVFRPFSSTKEDGLGLGLSISKSIVVAHGGRIGYAPSVGRGTRFFFTVPTYDI